MASGLLPQHEGLRSTTRLGFLTNSHEYVQVWEWVVLISMGIAAATASMFLDFNLRIPGHAILKVVLPIGLGFALVPRRSAGAVMGVTAFATSMCFRQAGFAGDGLSLGALTSLTATGPLLDLTLRWYKGGWLLYAGFALAGLTSNVLALLVRGAAKLTGFEHAGGRPLASWIAQASYTYVLCGLVAGLVTGMLWFYSRGRTRPGNLSDQPGNFR